MARSRAKARVNMQTRLHDNWRLEGLIMKEDMSVFPTRRFDSLKYTLQGVNLACETDDDGDPEWRLSYADPGTRLFPAHRPSIGPFILAFKSNVSCEETNQDLLV